MPRLRSDRTDLGRRASDLSPAAIPSLRQACAQFVRLLGMIQPYWLSLIQGLALGLVVGLVGMVTPFLSKLLIDEVFPLHSVTLMHVIVGGMLAVGAASATMGAIRGYFTQVVEARLNSAMTLMFFNHLQHLPVRFFDTHRTGEMMSRFQDVRGSLSAVSQIFETILVRGVYILLVPPMLVVLSWKLAIVALLTVPATASISTVSSRVLRKYWKASAEAYAALAAFQVEVLSNIRVLKTMALEAQTFRRADDQVHSALRHQLKAGGLGTAVGAMNGLLRTAGTALTTWVAWTLILRGELSLGTYIAFSAYVGYLSGPISQMASLFANFQQSAVTLGRMFEYLDAVPEQDPSLAYTPPLPIRTVITGDIQLHEVSFGYSEDAPVLRQIEVTIASGETVAIVGPSGAGKSTLLRLLCRIEEALSGSVFFGTQCIDAISLPDLRRQISVVWQDVGLVHGTLWDNLVLGAEAPHRAVVDEAVRICRLERMVSELPFGYDTPIAEWGATLSGGQRQRVAIARAVIRDTPILLLDEATANLDVPTERELLQGLLARLRGRTILFTTHRLANAALADRVLLLEEGKLVACAPHMELLEASESYRRMHAMAGSGR